MSYQVYKILHVCSIVLFFSIFAVSVFGETNKKWHKALTGLFIVVVLVSGMGLVARLGIPHGAGWPIWLKTKLGIWIFIAALGHVIVAKVPKIKVHFYILSTFLLVTASYLANYKIS